MNVRAAVRIRGLRRQMGITQAVFAKMIGVTVERLSKIERGMKEIDEALWVKIEIVTGASRDKLCE